MKEKSLINHFKVSSLPFPFDTHYLIMLDLQRGVLCPPWRDLYAIEAPKVNMV